MQVFVGVFSLFGINTSCNAEKSENDLFCVYFE